jgi:dTDP-glucose pyrophosphorylase
MKSFLQNLINEDASIIEALKKINDGHSSLTLFVLDKNGKMVGTLTDGDIRRKLISGLSLDDGVKKFMSTRFSFIQEGYSVRKVKQIRSNEIRLLPLLDEDMRIVKIYDLQNKKNILPLESVIMAGGRGERLRPLTDKIPKPMLTLGGKPIIEYNIDRLISYGIENIYISLKYMGQQVVDYFGNGNSKDINIKYIWEDQPMGTAGALSLVDRFETEYVLLMNSDLFTDADIEDLFLNVVEQEAVMGIASIPYTVKVPYAVFEEKENQVNGFVEKPTFTRYANAGIYIFKRELISLIPKNTFFNITDLMEVIINENLKVIHNPIIGYWIDIGQMQDYLNAQEIVKHLKNGNN